MRLVETKLTSCAPWYRTRPGRLPSAPRVPWPLRTRQATPPLAAPQGAPESPGHQRTPASHRPTGRRRWYDLDLTWDQRENRFIISDSQTFFHFKFYSWAASVSGTNSLLSGSGFGFTAADDAFKLLSKTSKSQKCKLRSNSKNLNMFAASVYDRTTVLQLFAHKLKKWTKSLSLSSVQRATLSHD